MIDPEPCIKIILCTYGLDGSTQRGCVSDLNKTDLFSCLTNNTTLCMTCNENKCNMKVRNRSTLVFK